MRIWRLDVWPNGIHENSVEWFTSQRAAKKRKAELKRTFDDITEMEPEPIDIPTNRTGLTRWLNVWFDTDNG